MPDVGLCGIDYPKLVEGAADYILYAGRAVGPRARLAPARRGRRPLGTTAGVTYSPRDIAPPGLVAAGSPTAYDRVCRALASSAHLS